ncbi:MAG TPA: DUF6188 family protein [Solirubrobacteraceae bacterium]|nr:DUF6188 family protein [Solirubrobacteraceae bacterium]
MTLPAKGPWDLPVQGFEVLMIVFAFPLDIVAYGNGGSDVTIRFGGRFTLTQPDGHRHELDAEQQSWQELAVVLALRHEKLASATASEAARLDVKLESGWALRAEADGTPYEHWEVTGPGYKLVALPGDGRDGVAVWSD